MIDTYANKLLKTLLREYSQEQLLLAINCLMILSEQELQEIAKIAQEVEESTNQ